MKTPSSNGDYPEGSEGSSPPKFLGTWRRWYTLVLVELAVAILLMYLLTVAFR